MKNKKIETYLPAFSGFYGTVWEAYLEDEVYSFNDTMEAIYPGHKKNHKLLNLDVNNMKVI